MGNTYISWNGVIITLVYLSLTWYGGIQITVVVWDGKFYVGKTEAVVLNTEFAAILSWSSEDVLDLVPLLHMDIASPRLARRTPTDSADLVVLYWVTGWYVFFLGGDVMMTLEFTMYRSRRFTLPALFDEWHKMLKSPTMLLIAGFNLRIDIEIFVQAYRAWWHAWPREGRKIRVNSIWRFRYMVIVTR